MWQPGNRIVRFQEAGHRHGNTPTAVGNKYRRAEENGLEREEDRNAGSDL
jgi:hypothetical protein